MMLWCGFKYSNLLKQIDICNTELLCSCVEKVLFCRRGSSQRHYVSSTSRLGQTMVCQCMRRHCWPSERKCEHLMTQQLVPRLSTAGNNLTMSSLMPAAVMLLSYSLSLHSLSPSLSLSLPLSLSLSLSLSPPSLSPISHVSLSYLTPVCVFICVSCLSGLSYLFLCL